MVSTAAAVMPTKLRMIRFPILLRSRFAAGAAGFYILSQSGERPEGVARNRASRLSEAAAPSSGAFFAPPLQIIVERIN